MQPAQITLKFSENGVAKEVPVGEYIAAAVTSALQPIIAKQAATAATVEKFHETAKKNRIDAELEALVKATRLTPAMIDAGVRARLERADAVAKFSDGDTELDKQFKELWAYPKGLVKFAERARQPGGGEPDGELNKVERFSETPAFAKALDAAGKRPADYVATFKQFQAKKPGLTAAEYGVPPEFAA